jgi:hypothetical protein
MSRDRAKRCRRRLMLITLLGLSEARKERSFGLLFGEGEEERGEFPLTESIECSLSLMLRYISMKCFGSYTV